MSSLPFEPALLQGHFFSIKIKSYKNFCISDDQLVSFDLLTFLDSHWEVLNDSVVQMVFLVTLHHPLFCTTHFLRLLTARRFGSYHCTAVNILCCKQIWDSWLITCFNITLWCKPEMLKKMKVEKSHLSLSGNKEHPCSRCGISQPASASQKTNKQLNITVHSTALKSWALNMNPPQVWGGGRMYRLDIHSLCWPECWRFRSGLQGNCMTLLWGKCHSLLRMAPWWWCFSARTTASCCSVLHPRSA